MGRGTCEGAHGEGHIAGKFGVSRGTCEGAHGEGHTWGGAHAKGHGEGHIAWKFGPGGA